MMLRGRSKDRTTRKVTPPGSAFMSNEQFADYLAELRNNRTKRPSGARPLPSSSIADRRESLTPATSAPSGTDRPLRCESAQSHRRAQSAMSNYSASSRTGRAPVQQPYPTIQARDTSPGRPVQPLKPSEVVPSATYIERGQRWMEKEEAVSLRDALEDMDLQKQRNEDEARLHAAAQEEASELVWQHENPGAIRSDGPYKYKEHLRKNSYAHARTQSVGRYSGTGIATGLARDIPRSVSGGSSNNGGMISQSRVPSGSSGTSQPEPLLSKNQNSLEGSKSSEEPVIGRKVQKPYHGLTKNPGSSARRQSSGKRNISGELAGAFTGEQIWEEPEETDTSRDRSEETGCLPAPLRIKPRNPLNRVQFVQDLPPRANNTPPEISQKVSIFEIHQNPPSQSRNAAYTANLPANLSSAQIEPEVHTKDVIEIRGDDIRQATSKCLRDRSPRLPTPAVVSDKPGRPIVSFDADWKPREADVKPVEDFRERRPEAQYSTNSGPKSFPFAPISKNFHPTLLPTIQLPSPPSIQMNGGDSPPIPVITISPTTIPTIKFPDTPNISYSELTSIPSINISDKNPTVRGPSRPLPDPQASSRPPPRHHATAPGAMSSSHWSPAAGNRATALCHQCKLPIEGRVVALRGISQRFHPHCFICHTCGTGLEALEISPEPAEKRGERISRIQRRAQGEHLEEIEGQTMADDGDSRLRFYCHLDWHELFAPRCKHCQTPIIGEHAVALGSHWHYGHFFCAECGDPFAQGMTHIEKDGYAWCVGCQTKRTQRRAPKCSACRAPVIGQYVQALGGEFHDACFRCDECGGGFEDGQIFPRVHGEETVAVCVGCMERELKA